jgi:hypothetical protein
MSNLLSMIESIATGNIETYRAGFAAGYLAGKRDALKPAAIIPAEQQQIEDEENFDGSDDRESVEELPGRGPWA